MKEQLKIYPVIIMVLFMFFVSHAADPIAIIIKSKGSVDVYKPEEAEPRDGRKGMVLYDGDKIKTAEASFCAIKFVDDKSLLRIKENSSCMIEGKREEEKTDKNVIVEIGTFFAQLFQPKGKFTITTPTSVASVKGTQWWTLQLQDGRTIYICLEGFLDCGNDAGKFLLKEGQTAIFTSQNLTPEIRLTHPDEIPASEEEAGRLQTLEIEFKNQDGLTKKLILDYQEK